MEDMNFGWYFCPHRRQLCQVINFQMFREEAFRREWFPGYNSVFPILAKESTGLEATDTNAFIAAAAWVADALNQNIFLAPFESWDIVGLNS